MEKNYNIDISYIDYLINIISNNGLFEYSSDIDVLNKLKRLLNNGESILVEDNDLRSRLQENSEYLSLYNRVYPYVRQIIKSSVIDEDDNTIFNKIKLSDNDVIELAQEFFAKQNSSYSQLMRDFLEDASDHLKFIPPTPHTEGESYFIRSTGDCFCIVPNYSNIMKFSIFTHECTHIFDWYINDNFLNNFLIAESHSLLMELLACDYLNNLLNLDKENIKRQLQIHKLIKTDSMNIYEIMQMLYLYKRFGEDGIKKIKRVYSPKYLEYISMYSLDVFFRYQLSYLIAIELYILYQSDKEKTLWLIREIVNKGNFKTIEEVLAKEKIEIGEHFTDYERKLILK